MGKTSKTTIINPKATIQCPICGTELHPPTPHSCRSGREAKLEELSDLQSRLLQSIRVRGLAGMDNGKLYDELDAVLREIGEMMREAK